MSDITDQGPQNAAQADASMEQHEALVRELGRTPTRKGEALLDTAARWCHRRVAEAVKVAREDADANAKRAEAAEAEVLRLRSEADGQRIRAAMAESEVSRLRGLLEARPYCERAAAGLVAKRAVRTPPSLDALREKWVEACARVDAWKPGEPSEAVALVRLREEAARDYIAALDASRKEPK